MKKNMYRRLRVTNYGGGICFIGHLTITLTGTIVELVNREPSII